MSPVHRTAAVAALRFPRLRGLLAALLAVAAVASAPTGRARALDENDLGLQAAAGPFDLTLQSCTFRGERLECLLIARNRLATADTLKVTGAELYDTEGGSYPDREIRTGGRSDVQPDEKRRAVSLSVPGETPVQVVVVFTDVSRYKKKASNLVIDVEGHRRLEFGDFPLARD